jgi:DNA-directed RNA polymerase specialized sigma24 family protein
MACAQYPSFGRRAWRAGISNPRSVLLALFGLSAFVVGILVRTDAAGISLVVVGSGILCLGVLLPVVQEAQIGTSGFKFTAMLPERETDFAPFVESQRDTLQRLAFLVTGDSARAIEVVEDTLTHAYGQWSFVAREHRTFYLVCSVVRKALGARKLFGDPSIDGIPDDVKPLLAIDAKAGAVALLHYYEGFSENQIATVMEATPEEVRAHLRMAEAELNKHNETLGLPPEPKRRGR